MTKISAKVIADSKNEFGNRITTMIVTFPRFILAELNTHRMMSRNSASSRAIPFEKMLEAVSNNPFIPIAWQKDHKGMQGSEYVTCRKHENAIYEWLKARDYAVKQARMMNNDGITKQLINRLLEPFMWHTVIITATEWENFFALRCPRYVLGMEADATNYRSWKDVLEENELDEEELNNPLFKFKCNKGQAEIHMMELAEQMWDAMNESAPKELKAGEWHIPFGDKFYSLSTDFKLKVATAMCARVSYTVVGEEGKEPNWENDVKLHGKLIESKHTSPFEHCAQSMSNTDRSRNFLGGWKQYREIINL